MVPTSYIVPKLSGTRDSCSRAHLWWAVTCDSSAGKAWLKQRLNVGNKIPWLPRLDLVPSIPEPLLSTTGTGAHLRQPPKGRGVPFENISVHHPSNLRGRKRPPDSLGYPKFLHLQCTAQERILQRDRCFTYVKAPESFHPESMKPLCGFPKDRPP